jgi:hypothetical protein
MKGHVQQQFLMVELKVGGRLLVRAGARQSSEQRVQLAAFIHVYCVQPRIPAISHSFVILRPLEKATQHVAGLERDSPTGGPHVPSSYLSILIFYSHGQYTILRKLSLLWPTYLSTTPRCWAEQWLPLL